MNQVLEVVKTLADTVADNKYTAEAAMFFGIGIMLFVQALVSLGEAFVCCKGVEGVARNPEATSKIRLTMIIGCAMVETCAIYTLVLAIIMLFVQNPAILG
ncbi:MAG: ATP synthase F0 subunit C [Bacilli bacterium]|jgi:F-type H+-transporting ATPase subunit c|nr:ATP synthase F0 subunit C [Bacilli bacterium]